MKTRVRGRKQSDPEWVVGDVFYVIVGTFVAFLLVFRLGAFLLGYLF